MTSRILTVPNQLTFLRLAFLPFFIMAIHYERYDWALLVLIVAGMSDALDGFLARGLNQKTPLGAYLDPIADKLLVIFFLPRAWQFTEESRGGSRFLYSAGRAAVDRERGDSHYRRLHALPPSIYGKAHHSIRNPADIFCPSAGKSVNSRPC